MKVTPDEQRVWDDHVHALLQQAGSGPEVDPAKLASYISAVADALITERRQREDQPQAPEVNTHASDCIEGQDSGLADCTCGAGNDPWRGKPEVKRSRQQEVDVGFLKLQLNHVRTDLQACEAALAQRDERVEQLQKELAEARYVPPVSEQSLELFRYLKDLPENTLKDILDAISFDVYRAYDIPRPRDLHAALDVGSTEAWLEVIKAIRAAAGVTFHDAKRMVDAVRDDRNGKTLAPRSGWRLLEGRDDVREGDEFWNEDAHAWVPAVASVGQMLKWPFPPVRRRAEVRDAG